MIWPKKMRSARCSQSWEVEAARDGRLSGSALDAVARHIEQCAECKELSDYFAGLGHALRELDEPAVDNAAVHELKRTILGRADAQMSGRSLPPPAPRSGALPVLRRNYVLASLVAALVAVVGLVVWKLPVRSVAVPRNAVPAMVETVDEGGARWTRTTDSGVEWIDLTDGTLRLRVQHAPGSRRVLVRVPDGEIEDIGTTFHVVVRRGRTERVGVDEGRVTIRLANMSPIAISSGTTWERPENPVAPPPAPPATTSPSSVALPPSAARVKPALAVPTASSSEPPDESLDAAKEDAAYLHTLTLLRAGRSADAKAAAKEYLRRFPDGFRRAEMAVIAEP